MSIEESLAQLRKRFEHFSEELDRYRYIVEMGAKKKSLGENLKTEANEIIGCQSRSWMVAEQKDGLWIMATDSEASIVKGLLALIEKLFNNRSSAEILSISADSILESLGLGDSITSQRQLGFKSALQKMRSMVSVQSQTPAP